MARIRNIKPDFWTDEKLVELDPWERLLFIGLWNFADDEGYMPYSPKRITMQVFPGDSLEVSRGIQSLISAGLLGLYDSVEGRVLHVTNWTKHQKVSNPSKSKYSDMVLTTVGEKPRKHAEPAPESTEPSLNSTEASRGLHKERERGRGMEREVKDSCPVGPDEFIDWYLEYPRKEAKAAAERAYAKARKTATHEQLLAGAQRYAADPNREPQYTKLPATWLNSGCWDDGPLPARGQQQKPTGSQLRLQAGYELLQQTRTETNTQHQIGA
jgi:hypothetical protein